MVYTLCIGSNWQRVANLKLARCRLQTYFPDIRFSEEIETDPLFFRRSDKFTNQLARFTSPFSAEEIKKVLKSIEREAGRFPEDKEQEIVKLDIDLLMCDRVVYKPEDMKRSYIMHGMASFDKMKDGK